jgi:hypothetical protein
MRNLLPTIIVATALTTGISHAQLPPYKADRASRAEFEDRIHTLNQTTIRNHAEEDAMHGVSVETGVPMEKLRRIHDHYPKVSAAGIFVACIIADNTKEDPEYIVKRGAGGQSWTSLAQDYGVPLDKIERRLIKLENYIRAGSDQRPIEKRERERDRHEFERRN